MIKPVLISILIITSITGLSAFDGYSIGLNQHTRLQQGPNSLLLAPGIEVTGIAHSGTATQWRASLILGRYFGSMLGATFSYNRIFGPPPAEKSVIRHGIGIGAYLNYQDIIFYTQTTRDYIYPAPVDCGLQINLEPLKITGKRYDVCIAAVSIGTSLFHPVRLYHFDLRLLQITRRFGGTQP